MRNIFNQINTTSEKRIVYENNDFNFDEYLIDMEMALESIYFEANTNHISAMHNAMISNMIEILQEGFSDFVNTAIEFFKKMIEKIKKFFKKAWMYLSSFMTNFNKFMKKYSKEINECNPNFDIMGYDFTLDALNIDYKYLDDLISSFNSEINSIDSMTLKEISSKRTKTMTDDNLNKIRGSFLKIHSVDAVNFHSKIKSVLRNNDSDKSRITIDKQKLNKIVDSYSDVDKSLKDSKKEKDKLISGLSNLQSFFTKGASVQYINGSKTIKSNTINNESYDNDDRVNIKYSSDNLEKINAYFNYKLVYSKFLSGCYNKLLVERTTAIKEYLHQSKSIIRQSIFSKGVE